LEKSSAETLSFGDKLDTISIIFLLLLLTLVWFWLSSIGVLEIARSAAKHACNRADVQFLDDTVASISLGLARNDLGRRVIRRTYRFEFSETGNSRIEGQVVMLGQQIESVTLEPYQIVANSLSSTENERVKNDQ
jgi:hypothetical protein